MGTLKGEEGGVWKGKCEVLAEQVVLLMLIQEL